MMNAPESKDVATWDIKGTFAGMGVKTNNQQAKVRVSAFTESNNDPLCEPPIELCFKLKTDRCLQGLRLPEGLKMSLTQET